MFLGGYTVFHRGVPDLIAQGVQKGPERVPPGTWTPLLSAPGLFCFYVIHGVRMPLPGLKFDLNLSNSWLAMTFLSTVCKITIEFIILERILYWVIWAYLLAKQLRDREWQTISTPVDIYLVMFWLQKAFNINLNFGGPLGPRCLQDDYWLVQADCPSL